MKETTIKKTVTVDEGGMAVAVILSILRNLSWRSDAKRIIKTVAAHYDLTVTPIS